jgi:hypothetical protein
MTANPPNPARAAAARSGSGAVCFGGEHFPDSQPRPNTQAENRVVREARPDAGMAAGAPR